jgi:putative transposase
MARHPRSFIEGQPHHIIQRGNNRVPMFTSERDYVFFLLCLGRALSEHGVSLHAFALMINHVHLLATPMTPQSLARAMQSLGRRYVQFFNRTYHRTGTLWEGRYRSMVVDTARYFFTCMVYIESNPVRAGIAPRPEEYRWSSYRANALGEVNTLLTPHALYRALGKTPSARVSAYRALFRRPLAPRDVEAIRQATNRSWELVGDGVRVGSDPMPRGVRVGSDPTREVPSHSPGLSAEPLFSRRGRRLRRRASEQRS